MKLSVLVFLLCGILSVKGSPVDGNKSVEEILNSESPVEVVEIPKESIDSSKLLGKPLSLGASAELIASAESLGSDEISEEALASTGVIVEPSAESTLVVDSGKINENATISDLLAEPVPEHVNLTDVVTVAQTFSALAVDAVPETVEKVLGVAVDNETVKILETQAVSDNADLFASKIVSKYGAQASSPAPSSSIKEQRQVGPVELGLRNVITASAVASEEVYVQMTILSAETSLMINNKAELSTAKAMNELYDPIDSLQAQIKNASDCGKHYKFDMDKIFSDLDASLTECTKNLTNIEKSYSAQNSGILNGLSLANSEMLDLPEACDLEGNFVVGTFCVVSNLADINDGVTSKVNLIKTNTEGTKQQTKITLLATDKCLQTVVNSVSIKINNLMDDVKKQCILRKDRN